MRSQVGGLFVRSPLWAALLLLAAACGQAVAAAPLAATALTSPTPVAAPVLATASASATLAPTVTAWVALAATGTPVPPHRPTVIAPAAATVAMPAPTATPTAETKAQPTLGAFSITPIAGATLVTPNPTAVAPQTLASSTVNILLIGTDSRPTDPSFRTDTLIVASINKTAGTVSLLSVPRDLFVYIPTYGMARINRAFQLASTIAYPGGGPALLEQTILYNLGLPVQYYALVNFNGFRQVVDTLGGIDVPVNCQVTEYKLKDPTLDERVVANYSLFTQPIGVTHMDGALALWYARARPVGGDFFRGYRQRQVLRAIYHKGLSANVIPNLPALYGNFRDVVQTDLSLWDVMQFVPLTTHLDPDGIRSLNIGPNQVTGWTTPDGEDVLIPNASAINLVVRDFLNTTASNQIAQPLTWVAVSNGAPDLADEALAFETLHNEGFAVKPGTAAAAADFTTIVDYTTSPKGSPLKRLQSVLHVADAHVIAQPDPSSPFQFQVILGADYNSCPRLDWMDATGTAPLPPAASTP